MTTMMYTTTGAARLLNIATTTLIGLEYRNAIPRAQRDSAGRRLWTPDDIQLIREYLTNRRRTQGRELDREPRSDDPEDGGAEPA